MIAASPENDVNQAKWLLVVAAWLAGCDGAATTPDDAGVDGGGDPTTATVHGSVTYDGAGDGSLLVGVFTWDEAHPSEPMGPPYDFVRFDPPTFPQDYAIEGLPPGAYFVGAVLDVGRDSPTLPGPEDVALYGARLDLLAGEDRMIDLALPNE